MDLIKIAEEAFATGKQHPSFKAGVRLYTSSFEFAQPCVFLKQLPGPILCASLITRTLYPEVTGSICLVP